MVDASCRARQKMKEVFGIKEDRTEALLIASGSRSVHLCTGAARAREMRLVSGSSSHTVHHHELFLLVTSSKSFKYLHHRMDRSKKLSQPYLIQLSPGRRKRWFCRPSAGGEKSFSSCNIRAEVSPQVPPSGGRTPGVCGVNSPRTGSAVSWRCLPESELEND